MNRPLLAATIAWFVAQIIKVFIDSIVAKKITLKNILSSGGMPSSHSSFVTALAVVIGCENGFDSTYFALAASFALIVMYDAFHVRRATGEQAKAINNIIEALTNNHVIDGAKVMKEILGHSPLQVAMGCILGIAVGMIVVNIPNFL